eukprot:9657680-Alexandrium_andersonii.AAC.1
MAASGLAPRAPSASAEVLLPAGPPHLALKQGEVGVGAGQPMVHISVVAIAADLADLACALAVGEALGSVPSR